MNLTLPEWYTDEVHRTMQEIMFMCYDNYSYTTQLKRLNGGLLVKKFIDNMNPRGDPNNKPSRKIYIYSAHELNIAAFARAHNISILRLPDYGSAFIVEKLRDENSNFYVRVINARLIIVLSSFNRTKSQSQITHTEKKVWLY